MRPQTYKREWTVILCHPKDWRLIPRFASRKDSWPRLIQFHWLFFYAHRIETPV